MSANTDSTKLVKITTSLSLMTDCIRESTIVFRPGTIATVLSALRTLSVLSTDKFPSDFMKIVA